MELSDVKEPQYGFKGNGNKLENLVERNKDKEGNILVEAHVDHDIGVMFMYQAMRGFFKSFVGNKPHLESYNVDIDTFRVLYNEYNGRGKGIKIDFVLINTLEYIRYTGDINVSTEADDFLYFFVTPIDNNDQPSNVHYVIFNLNHKFEIDRDVIDDNDLQNFITKLRSSSLYNSMASYSNHTNPTEYIYYPWADINNITIERNIDNRLYKDVQFVMGEVIEYNIILQYFKLNPYYNFDALAYKAAYLQHEKRLTIIGKYMPDDIIGKEGFFDMGDLRP
ncbi:hypothetical protein [Chryseobacterium hagamense]|uniref:Uncharacterized protein n=1 Tax=Chryseobacterium hagamense TaxID=395935 RepID=A0A511YIP0_9FLAO|nr:hypothetical protein [Chryseobacterium hagamense]GEN75060.1 hypothetical protein CHA01nite_08000 [Chryseobacterium hagamense]